MSVSVSQLNTQNALLLSNLMEFYESPTNKSILYRLINGQPIQTANGTSSVISLRIIDWFVTNYAKMHDTIYILPDKPRFRVYNSYKLELKAYSKRRFDPFARVEFQEQYTRKRSSNKPKMVNLNCDEGKCMTTIGQMNFFKWAIEHCILEYIVEHYEQIERDMNERGSNSSRSKRGDDVSEEEKKERKKREELSVSAYRCIKKETGHATFAPSSVSVCV